MRREGGIGGRAREGAMVLQTDIAFLCFFGLTRKIRQYIVTVLWSPGTLSEETMG